MLVTRVLTNEGDPLVDGSGSPLSGVRIELYLINAARQRTDAWDTISGELIAPGPVHVFTDSNGEFSIPLWPTSRGDRVLYWYCHVDHDGMIDFFAPLLDGVGVVQWIDFKFGGVPPTPTQYDVVTAHIGDANLHFNWRDAWAAETEDYKRFDAVSHGGSSWKALQDVPAGTEPVEGEYWTVLAEKGSPGLQLMIEIDGVYSASEQRLWVRLPGASDPTPLMSIGDLLIDTADDTPDAFTFTDQSGVSLATVVESSPITIAGIDTPATVSITGGEWAKSTDGGATWSAYGSADGTVTVGNKIKVRHTSSGVGGTATNTVLSIGGVSDTFTSTTGSAILTEECTNFTTNTWNHDALITADGEWYPAGGLSAGSFASAWKGIGSVATASAHVAIDFSFITGSVDGSELLIAFTSQTAGSKSSSAAQRFGVDIRSGASGQGIALYIGGVGFIALTTAIGNAAVRPNNRYNGRLELKGDGKVYLTITDTYDGSIHTANAAAAVTMNNIEILVSGVFASSTATKLDYLHYLGS